MSYLNSFKHADDVIAHLNTVIPTITDPMLQAKYTGFAAVAVITVYEIAIKEIFINFAKKKHKILGNFTESYFDRINGRIKINVIKEDYISRFGSKYVNKFSLKLKKEADTYLISHRRDIQTSYANLILWRNNFAHEGRLNATASYQDVVNAYNDGKEVIRCLHEVMNR